MTMYQPYPGTTQMPERQDNTAPHNVVTAVRLMYAGAAASLVYGASYLISQSGIKTAIEKHSPNFTAHQVTNTQHALVYGGIAGAVIATAIWVVIARGCLRGRSWARILGTVLFGIFTLDVLVGSFAVPQLTVLIKVIALLTWVIGLAVIILLWRRSSRAFFR
jgi:hypothetical protein